MVALSTLVSAAEQPLVQARVARPHGEALRGHGRVEHDHHGVYVVPVEYDRPAGRWVERSGDLHNVIDMSPEARWTPGDTRREIADCVFGRGL